MSISRKISVLLEMIKFKLTIFAMPFAFTGAFLAARGIPDLRIFFWIIAAMVGARTSAMGFNRIIDWKYDGANPRTEKRAIPAGVVNLKEAWLLVGAAALLFFFSCYQLNRLILLLSPVALGLTFFYSLTKCFTSLCHLVLGVALAFAPLGGWAAVRGSLTEFPFGYWTVLREHTRYLVAAWRLSRLFDDPERGGKRPGNVAKDPSRPDEDRRYAREHAGIHQRFHRHFRPYTVYVSGSYDNSRFAHSRITGTIVANTVGRCQNRRFSNR